MEWIIRYSELLNAQGIGYLRFGKILLREYGQIIIPLGPVLQDRPQVPVDEKKIFKDLKGKLVWWSYTDEKLAVSDWYAVIKDRHIELDNYKSTNTRNQIRKGLKLNKIKKISLEFLIENGFFIYEKAMKGFGHKCSKSKSQYQDELSKYAGFEDIIHFWGIFNQDELIGYSLIYCYDKLEANISEIRIDPNYLKNYPIYALIHSLSLEYIEIHRYNYISDGYRNILHKTNIQNLLIDKFEFHKDPLFLELKLKKPYNLISKVMIHLSNVSLIPDTIKAVLKLQAIYNKQKRLLK